MTAVDPGRPGCRTPGCNSRAGRIGQGCCRGRRLRGVAQAPAGAGPAPAADRRKLQRQSPGGVRRQPDGCDRPGPHPYREQLHRPRYRPGRRLPAVRLQRVHRPAQRETGVADVFSLYRLVEGSEGYEAEPVPLGTAFSPRRASSTTSTSFTPTTRTPACCNWRSATASCWPASRSASGSPTSACSAGRSPATAAKSATSTTAASATSPCRHRSTSNGSGLPARWWWRAASRT